MSILAIPKRNDASTRNRIQDTHTNKYNTRKKPHCFWYTQKGDIFPRNWLNTRKGQLGIWKCHDKSWTHEHENPIMNRLTGTIVWDTSFPNDSSARIRQQTFQHILKSGWISHSLFSLSCFPPAPMPIGWLHFFSLGCLYEN